MANEFIISYHFTPVKIIDINILYQFLHRYALKFEDYANRF